MSNENIFREVDEELRSERMRGLWRRFAPFVIGGAVAIVVLVAVNEGWSWYSASRSAQASQELYAALDAAEAGDLASARQQLETIAAEGAGGYPVLAQFRQAALVAEEGDSAAAVAAYDALASTQSSVRLRELALLLAGQILVDSGTLADVEARLGTLVAEESRLHLPALELLGLAQYRAGDFASAQASFEAVLNDPLVQSPTRNRMSYYVAQLLSEGAVAVEAPADEAEVPVAAGEEVAAPEVTDEAPAAEPALE